MISIETALKLRKAGLDWQPENYDFFAIPDTELNYRIFAITDMMAGMEVLQGLNAITFHGAVEWALDFVWREEVVWMPREEQLREQLSNLLAAQPHPRYRLVTTAEGYACQLTLDGTERTFQDGNASEAYAAAILALTAEEVEAGL